MNKEMIDKLKNYLSTKKLEEKIKNYSESQLKSLQEFLNQKFFNSTNDLLSEFSIDKYNKFEWDTKTYSSYGFYYALDNNRMKATKSSETGTMTVVQSKEKIEKDYKYLIKFKCGWRKGNYDIGVGGKKSGESCWIRRSGYCVSDDGIKNKGSTIQSGGFFKEGDIITLEVNALQNNREFSIYINEKKISTMNIDLSEELYFMAAMREVNNYIEVIEYKKLSCN